MTESKKPLVLVVGLGNPGVDYEGTRHNVGQMLVHHWVSRCAQKFGGWEACDDGAHVCHGRLGECTVLAATPTMAMNLSGRAVARLARKHCVHPARILVVHDDLDLAVGRLKLKRGGSSGGHRGVDSCVECLRSAEFVRLRVGIGRPADKQHVPAYVLQRFSPLDAATLAGIFERFATAEVLPKLLPAIGEDATARSRLIDALAVQPRAAAAEKLDEPLRGAPQRVAPPRRERRRRSNIELQGKLEGEVEGEVVEERPPKRQQSWGTGSLGMALAVDDVDRACGEERSTTSAADLDGLPSRPDQANLDCNHWLDVTRVDDNQADAPAARRGAPHTGADCLQDPRSAGGDK